MSDATTQEGKLRERIHALEEERELNRAEIMHLKKLVERYEDANAPNTKTQFYQESQVEINIATKQRLGPFLPSLFQILYFVSVQRSIVNAFAHGWFLPMLLIFIFAKGYIISKWSNSYLHWGFSYGVLAFLSFYQLTLWSADEDFSMAFGGGLFLYCVLVITVQFIVLSFLKMLNRILDGN